MNNSPQSLRRHIAIFGRRNVGKSSLLNALTGQQVAIVSPEAGTTTDPVNRAMEILPLGPCLLIDTAGFDDVGHVGELRNKRTHKVLDQTDMAMLVMDQSQEKIVEAQEKGLPPPIDEQATAKAREEAKKDLDEAYNKAKEGIKAAENLAEQNAKKTLEMCKKSISLPDEELGRKAAIQAEKAL